MPRRDTAPFAAYFELCAGELWPSGSEGESIEPRHGYGRSRAESAIMEALGAHWSLGGALSRPGSAEAPKRRPRPDAIARSCFVWDALETIVSQHRGDWENKPRVVPRELLAGPRRNQPPPNRPTPIILTLTLTLTPNRPTPTMGVLQVHGGGCCIPHLRTRRVSPAWKERGALRSGWIGSSLCWVGSIAMATTASPKPGPVARCR